MLKGLDPLISPPLMKLPKPEFHGHAKKACAMVSTGERRRVSNIIVRMGVVASS
jgi:L-fucose mutarotase/ribose pyranase (RbsD/FucU family)